MNTRKYLLVGGLALALILITVTSASVAAQDNLGGARLRARAKARITQMFGAGEFIKGLKITPDQRTQIKGILESSRPRTLQAVRDIVKAQLDMSQNLPGAADELAAAQLRAANLKKQIFEQIKPVLTPDQLAKMQNAQQWKTQRLQRLLDALDGRIARKI